MSRPVILINMNPKGGMALPKVKDRINHSTFGVGTVMGVGTDHSIVVKFDKHGLKELHWGFAKFKCKAAK